MVEMPPNGGIGDAKVVQLFSVPRLVFDMEKWIMATFVIQPNHRGENLSTMGVVVLS